MIWVAFVRFDRLTKQKQAIRGSASSLFAFSQITFSVRYMSRIIFTASFGLFDFDNLCTTFVCMLPLIQKDINEIMKVLKTY